MQPIFYRQAAQLYARTFHIDTPQDDPSCDVALGHFFSPLKERTSFVDNCQRLFSNAKYSVPFSHQLLRSCFVTALIQQFHNEKALVNSRTEAVRGLNQAAKKTHCNDVAQRVELIAADQFKNVQLQPLDIEAIGTEVNKTLNQIYLTEARRITRHLVRNNTPDVKIELESRHFDPHDPAIVAILEEARVAVAPLEPTAIDHLEALIRKKWQEYTQDLNAAVVRTTPSFSTKCQADLSRSFPSHSFSLSEFINKYIEVAVPILVAHYRVPIETVNPELTARCCFPDDYKLYTITENLLDKLEIDCFPQELSYPQIREKINAQLELTYAAAIRHYIAISLHDYPFRDDPQPILHFVQCAIKYLKEKFPRFNTWRFIEREVMELLIRVYAPYKASKEFWKKIEDKTSTFARCSNEEKCRIITDLINGEIEECDLIFTTGTQESLHSSQLQSNITSCLQTQISLLASYENNEPFARFKILKAQEQEVNDLYKSFADENYEPFARFKILKAQEQEMNDLATSFAYESIDLLLSLDSNHTHAYDEDL